MKKSNRLEISLSQNKPDGGGKILTRSAKTGGGERVFLVKLKTKKTKLPIKTIKKNMES